MARTSGSGGTYWVVTGLLIALGLLSLLPLIEWNSWWIRILDFSRLHFLIALVLVLGGYAFVWSRRPASWLALLIALGGVAYNAYKLVPYQGLHAEMALPAAGCADTRLSVMVANVHYKLQDADELFRRVRAADPDLFLAVETDEWWDERLGELSPDFVEQVQQVAGTRAAFGMHLFSQHPIESSEILFPLDNRVPAIRATVRLPDGTRAAFHGLHPRPPQPFQDSTMRDAQLLIAALEARERSGAIIVAGDFNAVPWERTFRRMMRIGGLLDPRVGRGYLATYDANFPILYWPLDHVLFSAEMGLLEIERLPAFGSDHWPVLVSLCHQPELAGLQSAPPLAEGDLQEAERSISASLESR